MYIGQGWLDGAYVVKRNITYHTRGIESIVDVMSTRIATCQANTLIGSRARLCLVWHRFWKGVGMRLLPARVLSWCVSVEISRLWSLQQYKTPTMTRTCPTCLSMQGNIRRWVLVSVPLCVVILELFRTYFVRTHMYVIECNADVAGS